MHQTRSWIGRLFTPSGKYHTGGIASGHGIRSDEIPVILTRGEHRISPEHAAKLGIKFNEESMTERVSPVDAIRRLAHAEDVDRLRLATDIINNHIEQARVLGHRSKLSMQDVQRMGLAIGMLDEVKPEAGGHQVHVKPLPPGFAVRPQMGGVSDSVQTAIQKAMEDGFAGSKPMTEKEAMEEVMRGLPDVTLDEELPPAEASGSRSEPFAPPSSNK